MPKFRSTCFFEDKIHKWQKRCGLQFLSQPLLESLEWDGSTLSDDIYRKPWDFISLNRKDLTKNSCITILDEEIGKFSWKPEVCDDLGEEYVSKGDKPEIYNGEQNHVSTNSNEVSEAHSSYEEVNQINQLPVSKHQYDQAIQQLSLLEMPNIALYTKYADGNVTDDIDNFNPVELSEEPLDLSIWCKCLIERFDLDRQSLVLTPPEIADISFPCSKHVNDVLPSNPVTTGREILDQLVWNPFKLDLVSKNISKTIKMLNEQCEPETEDVLDMTEQEPIKKGIIDYCSRPPSAVNQRSMQVDPLNSGDNIKDLSTPVIPVVSLPKISSGLNDSVDTFMKLRQKNSNNKSKYYQQTLNIVVSENKDKPIIHDIECEIDEYSMKFINRIYEYCRPDINTLVSKAILTDQNVVFSIEETYLDFILKEQIKNDNKLACEILLRLIPLKRAVTIAAQLDTESSLEYLKCLQMQDNRFQLCVRDLSAIQFEIIYSGHNTSKMMRLCNILKENKEDKCLILLSEARNSKTALMETVTKITGIAVAPALSFPDYKCYIINGEEIHSEFPWGRFSSVIEYNQSTQLIEDMISDINIKHYILRTIIPPQNYLSSITNNEEFKVIGYSSLDFKVLQCLETQHNFVVYQRQATSDYSNETIVIDERTCIVIIRNLNEIKNVREVSSLFIAISLSYSVLNVIFDVSTCHYPDLFSVVVASLAHFSTKNLNIKLFYCLSIEDTCKTIVKIAHQARSNISTQWKSTELWLKRTWLTEEQSNHEKLLSRIPCINVYVAQIMLTTYPLIDLMNLQLQEVIDNISVVPVEILKTFHECIHRKSSEQPISCNDSCSNNKTVQFDSVTSVQEYTPTQIEPASPYQRTSLPPLQTSFDLGKAVSQSYETPRLARVNKFTDVTKTPIKPKNVVKPFISGEVCSSRTKRAVEEFHKHSFSFSKRRKVLIEKNHNLNDGGQTTLFIEQ